MRATSWPYPKMDTLYLGGGTPSLVPIPLLERLLADLGACFDLSQLQELTLEANPDDVTLDNALAWKRLGVSRVSLGVQSLDDAVLARLNRHHSASQALEAVASLRHAGLDELSVDLIFGLPGQTLGMLQADVGKILALGVPHISLYGLTIEERTVFGRRTAQGTMPPPDDDLLADMMGWLQGKLADAGYRGYEISNYALPGHEAKHNSAYWANKPYLGLGPSAHSFDGAMRWHNVANNAIYLRHLSAGQLPASSAEALAPAEAFNEQLLTGLRLIDGVDPSAIADGLGLELPAAFWAEVARWQQQGVLQTKGGHLVLTPSGRLLADYITAKLFL